MLKYLRALPQLRHAAASEYTVVTGNQAADMDSCCSAILTAFLESARGHASVPMIQIPRHDLALRKDIEFVFRQLQIDPQWLLYSDTLETSDLTPVFIVDHNASTLRGKVTAIIDHHEPEPNSAAGLPSLDPNIIVKCGSCMSAVVNYYAATLPNVVDLFDQDETLAPLALYPILLDTANLTKKVEDADREAVKFLSQFKTQVSPFASLSVVKKQKDNIEGLSPADLLRKDYKVWGPIGISSLPKLFEKIGFDSYVLSAAMVKHQREAGLDVMVALGSGKRRGSYQRQLAIAAPQEFDVSHACPDLELVLVSDEDEVRYYDQRNTAASRKQIAPQLRRAWDLFSGR